MDGQTEAVKGAVTDADLAKIRAAGFDANMEYQITVLVNCLRYLQALSAQLGKPIGQISTDDLIQELENHLQKHSPSDA